MCYSQTRSVNHLVVDRAGFTPWTTMPPNEAKVKKPGLSPQKENAN